MSNRLVVTGSVALDSIETPYGKAEDVLGGSATYFALAASLYGPVSIVSAVGDGFPEEAFGKLEGRGIDCSGIERRPGVPTFRWRGRYGERLASRETLEVELAIFEGGAPSVPDGLKETACLFLANGSPSHQASVLDGMNRPGLVVLDTMNLWLEQERDTLEGLIDRVDGMTINDEELLEWQDDWNRMRAARKGIERGLKFLIVTKGEHGCLVAHKDGIWPVPACPIEDFVDPTGAGDAFSGGVMGVLAGVDGVDLPALREGALAGTACASFAVEAFGPERLWGIGRKEVDRRLTALRSWLGEGKVARA